MDELLTAKVVCAGGLSTNFSDLHLSEFEPGSAVQLINYEPSLFGGYRKINGYLPYSTDFSEVDPTTAEDKILVITNLGSELIVARKQTADATYKFYRLTGAGWTAYTHAVRVSTGVDTIRFEHYNFNGTEKVIFVDGVNPAIIFDGTNWDTITIAGSGVDIDNAGGNQALNAPSFVKNFFNHLFLAGDSSAPHAIAHSAPSTDYDWTVASGAGQLVTGFNCTGMWPFRDSNYIFGQDRIKRIQVSQTTFVINDVTTNVGCIASDSINEIGGDLIFLSQDGFRTIAGTAKIGDVQLETLSRRIQLLTQELTQLSPLSEIKSVLVRGKTQIRFFFSSESTSNEGSRGILGGIVDKQGQFIWEWSELRGIRTSCTHSYYDGGTEYVVHGDYDGNVYRQEQGNSFNGEPITAVYTTPFLDFGDVLRRKTMRKIYLFIRPEGNNVINTRLLFDWNNPNKLNPDAYTAGTNGAFDTYDDALYDTAVYGGVVTPYLMNNVQGSGFSTRLSFTDTGTSPSYSVQAIIFEMSTEGRK